MQWQGLLSQFYSTAIEAHDAASVSWTQRHNISVGTDIDFELVR